LSAMDSDKIMESFKNNIPEINRYIQYSYYLYKAFDDPDKTEYFFKAKEIFDKLLPTLNHNYAASAYQTFINYCFNKTNYYDIPFYRVLFDIYNEKLNRGFDEDIRFRNYPTNNYRDYVVVGLRLKEHEWVDNFITKYGKLLPDDYKPDEINITRAMLHLSKNEPDKAMKFLEKTKRKNYLHYIDISEMKMRIYYDKNDLISAEEEMIRMNKYISGNETIPKQRKDNYENFVRMFKKILQLKDKFSEEKLAKIETTMQRMPTFFRRAWIEEKLKEFKK